MANEPGFTPVTGQATPGFTPFGAGPSVASQIEQEAGPWRKATTGAGLWEQAKEVPGAIWQGLKNIPAGVAGMAEFANNPIASAAKAAPEMVMGFLKAHELMQKGGALNVTEGIGRGTAAALAPVGGGWLTKMGEQAGRGDILPTIAEVGTTIGGPKVIGGMARATAEFGANLRAASRTLDTARAIDEGRVGTMTELVRKPIYQYQAAKQAKIGRYAQGAIAQDQLELQKSGQQGTISAAAAAQKARVTAGDLGKLDTTTVHAIEDAEQGALSPNGTGTGLHNLNSIKNLSSDIGSKVAALRNAGKLREAKALDGLYDDLHQLSQDRAQKLGWGDQWKAYIEHTKDLKQLQNGYVSQTGETFKSGGGILGDLVGEPNHAAALRTLISPDRAAEVGQLMDKMKEEGVDPGSVRQAQDIGKQLEANTQEIRSMFIGKLRAIMKYPAIAGPAAAASAVAGRASGIPGMTFVLPLIVAGKVAGLLDRAAIGGLLRDLQRAMPRESMQPYMQTPASPDLPQGGTPTPTGGGFKGGINPQGTESMTVGKQSTAASQTALVEQLQKAAAEGTPEEQAMAKQRLSEMGEQEAAPKFAESRSELAGKLSKARGSRAQSGVYKGKR